MVVCTGIVEVECIIQIVVACGWVECVCESFMIYVQMFFVCVCVSFRCFIHIGVAGGVVVWVVDVMYVWCTIHLLLNV